MPSETYAFFRTRDGVLPVRVRRSPVPHIEISETALHERDGVKPGGEDVPSTVQIVRDSRGRHRAVVPDGEETSYKLSDHEVCDVIETPDGRGGRTRRYVLRRK